MNRHEPNPYLLACRPPHTRGDEPGAIDAGDAMNDHPPHTRGDEPPPFLAT